MKTLKALFAGLLVAILLATAAPEVRASLDSRSAEITVSGTVTDADSGDPIVAAFVRNVNSQDVGTVTDAAGRYSIKAAVGDRLEFSYLGYDPETVEVKGAVLDVKLQAAQAQLDESRHEQGGICTDATQLRRHRRRRVRPH